MVISTFSCETVVNYVQRVPEVVQRTGDTKDLTFGSLP